MNKQQLIDYIKGEMNRWNLDGKGQTIEVEPLGLSVNIRTVFDDDPDLSWLGEITDKPEGNIAYDRKTGLVTQEDRGSFPELPEGWEYDRLYGGEWGRKTLVLFVDAENGNLSHLHGDDDDWGCTGEDNLERLVDMSHVSGDHVYHSDFASEVYFNGQDGLTPVQIAAAKEQIIPWLVAVNEWARTHTPDGELILSDDGPAYYERHDCQYFVPANSLDDIGLEGVLQDWKRLEGFYRNDWGLYGLRLTITIEGDNTPVFEETQWSLELDGGKDDQEQIEEAISELLYGFDEEYLTERAEELRQQAETLVVAAAKLGQGGVM